MMRYLAERIVTKKARETGAATHLVVSMAREDAALSALWRVAGGRRAPLQRCRRSWHCQTPPRRAAMTALCGSIASQRLARASDASHQMPLHELCVRFRVRCWPICCACLENQKISTAYCCVQSAFRCCRQDSNAPEHLPLRMAKKLLGEAGVWRFARPPRTAAKPRNRQFSFGCFDGFRIHLRPMRRRKHLM